MQLPLAGSSTGKKTTTPLQKEEKAIETIGFQHFLITCFLFKMALALEEAAVVLDHWLPTDEP